MPRTEDRCGAVLYLTAQRCTNRNLNLRSLRRAKCGAATSPDSAVARSTCGYSSFASGPNEFAFKAANAMAVSRRGRAPQKSPQIASAGAAAFCQCVKGDMLIRLPHSYDEYWSMMVSTASGETAEQDSL